MSNEPVKDQSWDWLPSVNTAMGPLADRDYLYMLDLAFDPEAQLRAIHGLLAQNQEADRVLVAEIQAAEERAKKLTGIWNEHAVDECVDLMHHSVYQDATHSMSALGMLAPFIEGLFAQCFAGIGQKFFATGSPPNTHERWKAASPQIWDCHYRYTQGRLQKASIVESTEQLATATGLHKYIPADIWRGLTALFAYRNKMFHHGMEWPENERTNFQNRIATEKWPTTWFSQATSGGDPWVFYMTQEFIDHCHESANKLIDAFGCLIKNDLWPRQAPQMRR